MNGCRKQPFTLVEMLVSLATLALISAAAAALLDACLTVQQAATTQARLHQDAMRVMDGIGGRLRFCPRLYLPNDEQPAITSLAFSRSVDDKEDFYGGDLRFPRVADDPENVETYTFDSASETLFINDSTGNPVALLAHVTQFDVNLQDGDRVRITLTLADGEYTVTLSETICLRNLRQQGGRRVR